MEYIVRGIIVFTVIYRIWKWSSRRCICRSFLYRRYHKIFEEARGLHTSITFRYCLGCGDFTAIKSETKRFSRLGLWWRKTFHPWQFRDVGECMQRAGILVSMKLRPQPLRILVQVVHGKPCIPKVSRIKRFGLPTVHRLSK
jgi:hypothetical protein